MADSLSERMSIFVDGLEISARIGVYSHERGRSQNLLIDVELHIQVPTSDQLTATVDYETVQAAAAAIVDEGHVDLVEEFARRLGVRLMQDDRLEAVTVRVSKASAIPAAKSAGATWQATRTTRSVSREPREPDFGPDRSAAQ